MPGTVTYTKSMQRVYAQGVNISTIFSPARAFPDVSSLVRVVVANAFVLAGVLCFLLLVFGGFSFIMGAGSGDTKQTEKGKQAVTGAIVGLLLVISSFWILQILGRLTGMDLLNPRLQ